MSGRTAIVELAAERQSGRQSSVGRSFVPNGDSPIRLRLTGDSVEANELQKNSG